MAGVDRRSGGYGKRIREKFFLSVHKNGVGEHYEYRTGRGDYTIFVMGVL